MVEKKGITVPDFIMETFNHFTIELYLDPDEPGGEDDTISLVSDDGSYEQTLKIKEVAKKSGNKITITFNGVVPDKIYDCEVDFKEDAEGNPQGSYYFFKEYKIIEDDIENIK